MSSSSSTEKRLIEKKMFSLRVELKSFSSLRSEASAFDMMALVERFFGVGKSGPRIGQLRVVVCVFTNSKRVGKARKTKEAKHENMFPKEEMMCLMETNRSGQS